MKTAVFSVYDVKAEAYLPPFFMNHEGQATRTFGDCVNADEHQFHAHPSDYTLFNLGTWDNESAEFQPLMAPKSLGNGIEFVNTNSSAESTNVQIGNDTQFSDHPQSGNPA